MPADHLLNRESSPPNYFRSRIIFVEDIVLQCDLRCPFLFGFLRFGQCCPFLFSFSVGYLFFPCFVLLTLLLNNLLIGGLLR